jgi:SAM-dependent methyltransferase
MDERATGSLLKACPVCGQNQFAARTILWPELIAEWQLAPWEVDYINLQQGFSCTNCKNHLRAMTLAAAVTKAFGFDGSFKDFCDTDSLIRSLIVIEINAAGNLTPFLQQLPKHELHSFPEIDMQRMSFGDASIDVIIHSDTLEHVFDSKAALQESWRILKPGGRLFYTVPIIVGRLTRTRRGLPPSHHGNRGTTQQDYTVQTEYGADFWCEIFEAGFQEVTLTSLIFPASVAICATKTQKRRRF